MRTYLYFMEPGSKHTNWTAEWRVMDHDRARDLDGIGLGAVLKSEGLVFLQKMGRGEPETTAIDVQTFLDAAKALGVSCEEIVVHPKDGTAAHMEANQVAMEHAERLRLPFFVANGSTVFPLASVHERRTGATKAEQTMWDLLVAVPPICIEHTHGGR